MARMPFSTWDPANDTNSTRVCTPRIVCVHTIVGYAPAKAAHFSTRGDGYRWQHRDTERQSAANYNGNGDVIAIENADHGPGFPAWNTNDGHAVPGFTAAQIESIAEILVFCHRAHGIPLELIPDTKPGRRGVGYHRQGIDGNFAGYRYPGRVPGGVLWSTATGKVCPGDRRITQLIEIIIPRARVLAGLDPGKGDMALADEIIRIWTDEGWKDFKASDLLANAHNYAKGADLKAATAIARADAARVSADAANAKLVQLLARPVADVEVAASLVVDELISRGVTGGATAEEVETAVRSGLNAARLTTN